jgi:hypothetical protein
MLRCPASIHSEHFHCGVKVMTYCMAFGEAVDCFILRICTSLHDYGEKLWLYSSFYFYNGHGHMVFEVTRGIDRLREIISKRYPHLSIHILAIYAREEEQCEVF